MKKILFLLALAFSISFGASAMNLKEAFDALANVPNVSAKTDYTHPILGLIANGEIARAENLNASQILESGNAVYTILNQVPMTWMINGGNNHSVAAFVYATPESKNGLHESLIILMTGKAGDITVIYGGIDDATKTALQNAPLYMDGASIRISASLPDGNSFNIAAD